MRSAGSSALFAEMVNKLVTGNRFHPATFQIVVTAVQHFARFGELGNIPGHCVFKQPGGGISSFDHELVNRGLQVGCEMYFHAFKLRENLH